MLDSREREREREGERERERLRWEGGRKGERGREILEEGRERRGKESLRNSSTNPRLPGASYFVKSITHELTGNAKSPTPACR